MESASGRSLTAWSAAWLETAGADRLAVDDGVLTRTPPPAHPADRPHTLDVAAFADGREVARVDVVVNGSRTAVPGLDAVPPGALVVPNAGDLTWAEVSLDPETVAALPVALAIGARRPGAGRALGRAARCGEPVRGRPARGARGVRERLAP